MFILTVKRFSIYYFIAALAISCYGIDTKKIKDKSMPDGEGFAVIELFTSEGCSSCPAADELVSKVLDEHKQDVYILSYHVDYWNRLGWKDKFSKSAFSERQKQYARYLSLEGVYTPQIVVNGSDEFVGSNETRLRSSVMKSRHDKSGLTIKAENLNATVHLIYTKKDSVPVLLNVALIQPEAFTNVRSGENNGRKLHHINIVRKFKTIETSETSGSIDIEVPKDLKNMPMQIIAFIQQKDDFNITGVKQVSINQQ